MTLLAHMITESWAELVIWAVLIGQETMNDILQKFTKINLFLSEIRVYRGFADRKA